VEWFVHTLSFFPLTGACQDALEVEEEACAPSSKEA
jgi:hypothetical protein